MASLLCLPNYISGNRALNHDKKILKMNIKQERKIMKKLPETKFKLTDVKELINIGYLRGGGGP
ncbi:hypothetical protein SporoS204_05030 [Sporosarcina ureae]|uniref:Uncharacterized protein n=1 Tax=Sporosarcina ureae TaxID=1571 RepID=A0ABM6JTK8_SPOUR|nr:hypothetical protein SporoS204_05030 [Sporosarcina ureae]